MSVMLSLGVTAKIVAKFKASFSGYYRKPLRMKPRSVEGVLRQKDLTANKIPVTVVVPVKNEEASLGRCLARLARFGEIIVVDSSSTDRSGEIARAVGACVVNFEWNGHYPKKRNWFLLNHRLAFDWVLFLDADELVDDAFCEVVCAAVQSGRHNGYWLNFSNCFLGRPMAHGVAQRKLALFRAGKGLYERIEEESWTQLDMEIHEHPVIEGSVGVIETRIEHRDDRGVARFIDRHRDYALWEARRVQQLKRGDDAGWAALTDRQRFKYRYITRWWYPWSYFIYAYFIKCGFLDGAAGLYYAFFKTWYFLSIRLLIIESQRTSQRAR
jgi:glycosyltransferase involved in cell wall biosynthesis